MSWVAVAVAGAAVVGAIVQKDAAADAASAQTGAAAAGIGEQGRQFDTVNELFSPYRDIGIDALQDLRALQGLDGPEAEQAAIDAIEASPNFQAQLRQSEEAILANASATGGLRGGDTQAALAQFRPALLAQEIESRYGNLAGLVSLGSQASAGTGTAALQTGQGVSALLQQQGAAQAGATLSQGAAYSNIAAVPATALATYYGLNRPNTAAPTAPAANTSPYVTHGNPLGLTQGQGL